MVTDYQTTKVYFSSWLPRTCPQLWASLHPVLHEMNVSHAFIRDTADIWCRDYMPIQLSTNEMVVYKYWPDYLVNHHLHQYLTDSQQMAKNIQNEFPGVDIIQLDLIVDGGNVVKCGDTIIMTEKVFEENKGWPAFMVIDKLEEAFGCEVLFLPWDKSEIYGHSDGIIHYLGDNRLLLTNYNDFSPAYYKSFMSRLESKFEVIPLEYSIENKNENSWAYINYLQVGSLIFVPQLDIPEDQLAIEQIRCVVPDGFRIVGIPALEAVNMGGALNCISWNIDDHIVNNRAPEIKFISPLQENAFCESVIYDVLKQRLDFSLSEDMWYEINEAFGNYWNNEVGVGNFFDCDSMFRSIKHRLISKQIVFPDYQLYRIVNEIYDFIDTIPGVVLHD